MAGAPRTSEKTGSGRRCCVDRPGLHSPGGWGKAGFNARQPTTAPHRAAAPRGPGKGWLSQGHPHPSCARKFGVREEAGDTGPQATRALGASSAPAATIPRRRGTPGAGVKPQQPSEPPSACELGQAVNPLLKRAKPGPTLRVSTGETPSTALAYRTGNTTSSTALLTAVGTGRRCVGGAPPPAGPAPASPLAGHGRLAFCPATRSSRPLVSSAPQYGGSGGRRHGHTHNPKPEDWYPAPILLLPPPPRDPGPADTVPLEPQPGVRGCKPTLWPSASGRVSRVGGAGSSPAQGPMEQPPGPHRTPRLRRLAGLGASATWGRASSCSPAEASAIGPELSMHQAPCKHSLRDPLHSIGPTSQVRKPRGRECP